MPNICLLTFLVLILSRLIHGQPRCHNRRSRSRVLVLLIALAVLAPSPTTRRRSCRQLRVGDGQGTGQGTAQAHGRCSGSTRGHVPRCDIPQGFVILTNIISSSKKIPHAL